MSNRLDDESGIWFNFSVVNKRTQKMDYIKGPYYVQPHGRRFVVVGATLSSSKKMMAVALADPAFNWEEAKRLAALPSFDVLSEMLTIKREVANGK